MLTCDGCGDKDYIININCLGCRLLGGKSVEQPVGVMPIPYKTVHSDGNITYKYTEEED